MLSAWRKVLNDGYISAIWVDNFRLVWLGQTMSLFGDAAFAIALPWQVLLLTGSATAMGLVYMAQNVTRLGALSIGGVLADRLARKSIILWCDVGRGVVVLLVAALGAAHWLHLWAIVGLGTAFGVFDGFFIPAFRAIPPELVETTKLPSANSLMAISEQASELIGPLLGAGLIAVGGTDSVFALDGLSFFVSAILLGRVASERIMRGDSGPNAVTLRIYAQLKDAASGYVKHIGGSLKFVFDTPWLWISIIVAAGLNAAFVGSSVALPFLAHSVRLGAWLLGAMIAARALGALAGTFPGAKMAAGHKRGSLGYLSLVVAGIGLTAVGMRWGRNVAESAVLVANVVTGVGLSVYGIIWSTLMQERIEPEMLGRVASLDYLGSYALVPVSYVLSGLMTTLYGPRVVFLAVGGLSVALAAGALVTPNIRMLD